MIRMLIWKEWREQRWKLALGCVLLVGFTLIGLRSRLAPDQTILIMTMFLGGFLFPVLVAMDLVAAERADGTMDSLLGLPVHPSTILTAKLLVAAAACVVPVAAAGLAAWCIAGGREMQSSQMWRMCLGTAGLATSVLIWASAFAIRQRSEARAALVAMGVLAGWALLAMMYALVDHEMSDGAMAALPGSLVAAIDPPDVHWLSWAFRVQGLYVMMLVAWMFLRFGKAERRAP